MGDEKLVGGGRRGRETIAREEREIQSECGLVCFLTSEFYICISQAPVLPKPAAKTKTTHAKLRNETLPPLTTPIG